MDTVVKRQPSGLAPGDETKPAPSPTPSAADNLDLASSLPAWDVLPPLDMVVRRKPLAEPS